MTSFTDGERTITAIMYRMRKRSDSTFIYLNLAPDIRFTLDEDINLCEGDTAFIQAGIFGQDPLWSTGDSGYELMVTQAGDYWLEQSNVYGCTHRDTVSVLVEQVPTLNLGDDQYLCTQDGLVLEGGDFINYLWSDGSIDPTLTVHSPGTYWVAVDNDGPCLAVDTIQIFSLPTVHYLDLGEDQIVLPGDVVAIPIMSSGTTISQLTVTPPDIVQSLSDDEVLLSIGESTEVIVEGIDEYGCLLRDTILLTVPAFSVFIPNVFSPNGDGTNELFTPYGSTHTTVEQMIIYDRFGRSRYELNEFPADGLHGWSGRVDGELLSSGVYIYEVIIRYADGSVETRVGDVTMVR